MLNLLETFPKQFSIQVTKLRPISLAHFLLLPQIVEHWWQLHSLHWLIFHFYLRYLLKQ
jgi:hypothetical protein